MGNVQMQKAIVMAQLALFAAVLVPGIAVGIEGWLLALVGPIDCVTLCELCKLITKMQKQQYRQPRRTSSGPSACALVDLDRPR